MDEVEKLEQELQRMVDVLDKMLIANRINRDRNLSNDIYLSILRNKAIDCLKIVRSLEETDMYEMREFRKELENKIK